MKKDEFIARYGEDSYKEYRTKWHKRSLENE